MTLIDPGAPAPPFSLRDQDDAERSLSDYAGAPLVLYFYPKDNTQGCTRQAVQMTEALPEFEKLGCAVVGISPLGVASKAKFAAEHAIGFPILADEDEKVCDRYGVWQEKKMYGNTFMGVVRTTYLINASGKVAKRWDNVRVPQHAEKVLEALRELR